MYRVLLVVTTVVLTVASSVPAAIAADISCDPGTEVCPVEPVNVLPADNFKPTDKPHPLVKPGQALAFEGPVQSGWELEAAHFLYYDGSLASVATLQVSDVAISGGQLSGEGQVSVGSSQDREFVRVRVRVKRGVDRYTAFTDLVEIDSVLPRIEGYVVDGPSRIRVDFSEEVVAYRGDSRFDWFVNPDPNDTLELRPTSVSGTGDVRYLALPFTVGPDETPFVRYRPADAGGASPNVYHDGAQNDLDPGNVDGRARDTQPPVRPTINTIEGRPAAGGVLSNERRPTLVASGPPNGNWIEFWLDANGNGEFDEGPAARLGEAQVASGSATFRVPTNHALTGGTSENPTLHRFFARARDEAQCNPGGSNELCPNYSLPSTASEYRLDVLRPQVVRAGTSGTKVTVSFSEPVLGANDPAHWTVTGDGGPVTAVTGTGQARILDAAGVQVGDTVNYTPPESNFLRDAAGNAATGFPIQVTEGLDLILHPASVSEDGGSLQLPISISGPPPEDVRVDYRTTGVGTATSGDDYSPTTSGVTFQAGNGADKVAVIPLHDDGIDEHDEVLQIELYAASKAVIAVPTALGTILDDDDPPSLSVGDKTVVEGDEGTKDVVFPVTLTGASGKSIDASWSLIGDTAVVGFDVRGSEGILSIPPGQTSAQLVAKVEGDTMYERDERFQVRLSDPRNVTLADPVGVGTIQNDDAPPVLSIDDAEAVEFDSKTNTASIALRLDQISGVPARATFASRDVTARSGSDYEGAAGSVTVPAGVPAAHLTWTIRPDALDEADEWFEVALSDPIDATLGRDVGTVTILDNDGPTHTVRNGGRDRVGTSVEVSRDTFPGTTDNVVIARADAYPDALAGGPLAVELVAPILLTPGDGLHSSVRQEIQRLDARTAYLLGGEAALTPAVAAELEAMGLDVVRIGGENRFETAALIANQVGGSHAYVTEGFNVDPNRGWPDAVAVSALAAHQRAPILLTRAGDLPVETVTAIGDLGVTGVTVVGGPVAVSEGVEAQLRRLVGTTERLAGDTRYGTSRAVADRSVAVGMEPRSVWFATGRNWPDSLAAGPAVVHQKHGVLVLIDGQNGFGAAPEIGEFLDIHLENILRIVLVGGESAISDEVADSILLRIGG